MVRWEMCKWKIAREAGHCYNYYEGALLSYSEFENEMEFPREQL